MTNQRYKSTIKCREGGWCMIHRHTPDEGAVVSFMGGTVVTLCKPFPGKWKIVGEDTYAKTPDELFDRLRARESRKFCCPVCQRSELSKHEADDLERSCQNPNCGLGMQ